MYKLLAIAGGLVALYEIVAFVSRIQWRESVSSIHAESRANRLRILGQRGDVDLYEASQTQRYGDDVI